MFRARVLLRIVLVSLVGALGCSSPTPDHTPKGRLAELVGGEPISLTEAIAIAEREVEGGIAVEAELEIEGDEAAYEVELLTADGRIEVEVHPVTGRVLEVEREGEDDEDEDDDDHAHEGQDDDD